MLNCREVSALLSDQLDRRLSLRERIGLRLHLAMCRACGRVEGQLRFLREAMCGLPKQHRGVKRP
ncbi:MAG TPA: zf-HC2 domain-containing protein [Burkholderiales bacterium]|nr:zf-HC2 domain-containing protein [Burkholderiales bacterium]